MPKISELSVVPLLTTSAYLPVVSSGVTYRVTFDKVFNELTGFTQSGSGATARTVQDKMRDSPVDLKDFGAVCDGVTDDYNALLAAYNSGATRIRLPAQFYTSQTLYVQKHLIFEGNGAGRLSSTMNTIWKFPTSKSAVVVERGASTYGDDSEFFGISFEAAAKSTTSTTGSITAAAKTLTLASAQDFATGQLVLVRGAGTSHPIGNSWYLTAATTAGSPTVTMNQTFGIHPGMVLQVAGANFPAGTYVVSRATNVLTMSANAVNTVTAGALTGYDDLCALVIAGGGTTTLTLNEAATTTVANAVVEHYDCAIYTQSRIKAFNCRGTKLSGATLYVHSGADVDSRSGQATNANNFLFRDIHGDNGRNVIRTHGGDSNAGTVDSCLGISSITEFNFVEASLLGNCYLSCHVSGGYGYRALGTGNTSTFYGCYREGGTYNIFDVKVFVMGGNMGGTGGNAEGGNAFLTTSSTIISNAIKPFSSSWPYATKTIGQSTSTDNPLESMDASAVGGNAIINFRRSNTAGDGVNGLWGWYPNNSYQNSAMLWPDSGHPSGHSSGAYFRNGINLGGGTASLATTNFRKQVIGTAAPASGTWQRGDIVWNQAPSSGGFIGWVCTVGGTPGTWTTFGAVT